MASESKILYIKGDRDVEVTKPDVTLGDLLSMECTDMLMLAKIKTLKIVRFKKSGRQRRVVSVLKIIACIHEKFPETDVQNLGPENAGLCMAYYKDGIRGSSDFLRSRLFHHGI